MEVGTGDYGFYWADVMKMVEEYWQEVGIDIEVKPVDNTLLEARKGANKLEATVWLGDNGGMDPRLNPRGFVPWITWDQLAYGLPWAEWYRTGGESGEDPPQAVQAQQQAYEAISAATDPAEQDRPIREVLEMARELFYVIGIVLPPASYGIKHNDFQNVPTGFIDESDYPTPGPTSPEQFFTTRA